MTGPGELSPAMEAVRQDGYEIGLQEGYEAGLAEGRAALQSVPDGGEAAMRNALKAVLPLAEVTAGFTSLPGSMTKADMVRRINVAEAALAAAPPPDGSQAGWRPIETAPKNDTEVLTFTPQRNHNLGIICGTHVAFWSQNFRCWQQSDLEWGVAPSHWIPLPEPPAPPPLGEEAGVGEAWANLEGAITDLERTECDPVSLRTLKRIAGQLAALASPSGGK